MGIIAVNLGTEGGNGLINESDLMGCWCGNLFLRKYFTAP